MSGLDASEELSSASCQTCQMVVLEGLKEEIGKVWTGQKNGL
jgi:hypothetical protein